MRWNSTALCCLFFIACSLNGGCANPDDVNIPLEVEQEADARQPRDPRTQWLSEFGVRIEASSNARLSSLHGKPSISVDGVTAAYDVGSTAVTSVAIAIISDFTSSDVVSAVKDAVLHVIRKDQIPRAEIGFKKASKSPILKSCVVRNRGVISKVAIERTGFQTH